jgi:hypothetical protein
LHSIGIVGNKYWDQGSRTRKEGQRNYVLFHDGQVQIVGTLYQPAFHGSKVAGIRALSTAYVGSGLGQARHGWGLYFSADPAWKAYYANAVGKTGATYTVDIPDDAELLRADEGWTGQSPAIRAKILASDLPAIVEAAAGQPIQEIDRDFGRWVYSSLARALGSAKAASLRLAELGIPGQRYEHDLAWSIAGAKSDTMYLIWDDSRVKITGENAPTVQEFRAAQDDHNGPNLPPRGAVHFGPDGEAIVTLFEQADLSTFLHESGHLYLRMLSDLANVETATPQLRADYDTIVRWLGFKDHQDYLEGQRKAFDYGRRQRDGEKLTPEEQATAAELTDRLEKFARGFEAYLFEGKSPSVELAGPFERFRSWLLALYRNVRNIGVELTDEVRGVFDRLLATEDEIGKAEAGASAGAIFENAAAAGMSDTEFLAYRQTVERQRLEARRRLQAQLVAEKRRELSSVWREEREKIREDVSAELDIKPEYGALHFLRTGKLLGQELLPDWLTDTNGKPLRLSGSILNEMYGDQAGQVKRRLAFMWTKDGGVHPDVFAPAFGFKSGDEMIQRLMQTPSRGRALATEVNRRMTEKHGDLLTDGRLQDAAAEAFEGAPARLQKLIVELRALHRRTGRMGVPAPADVLRTAARATIRAMKVQEVRPGFFQRTEGKAARAAFAAAGSGDYATAYLEKQRELQNHFLYLEAREAREETDKTRDFAYSLTKVPAQARLGKAGGTYQDMVNSLLERFEFRKVPGTELARRESFRVWYEEQIKNGLDPVVPEALKNEAYRVNWRQMTVEELLGLGETLRNIAHLAGLKNSLLVGNTRKAFEIGKQELIGQLLQTYKDAGPLVIDPKTLSGLHQALEALKRGDSSLLKIEELIRRMDGGRVDGPWHKYVWNLIADAQNRENIRAAQISLHLAEALSKMPKEYRDRLLGEERFIKTLGQSLTFQAMIAVALNMGNDSNYQKLLQGKFKAALRWDETTIEEIVGHLSRQDWEFVQQVWDIIHSLWPEIEALEKRLTGVAPPAVEAKPFARKLADGTTITLRGGYYPLIYDKRQGGRAARLQASENVADLFDAGMARAMTPHGHVIARIENYAEPIKLDVEVITRHITQVLHDLTHREAILSIYKILTDPDVRQTMYSTLGEPYTDQFIPWLKYIANEPMTDARGTDFWTRFAQKSRLNAAVVGIGFRFTTVLQNFANFAQAIEITGAAPLADALKMYLVDPAGWTKQINELSPEMRFRFQTLERDLKQQFRMLLGNTDISAQAKRFAYYGMAMTDALSAYPTWLAIYRRELRAGETQEFAVRKADEGIRLAFGSGSAKDLAAVQRGGELMKLVTMFYSYFSAIYNRQRAIGYDARVSASEGRIVQDFPRLLSRTLMIWLVPALLSELLSGRPPKDDEGWWHWAITKSLLWPALTVPFIRDVASALEGGRDFKYSPAANVGDQAVKLIRKSKALLEGEQEVFPVALDAFKASGYVFGLPTGQAAMSADYLYDIWTGEESPQNPAEAARDFMFSRYRRK